MGANFHRAMVATAPGEERLIGRRPVRNWTQLYRQSLIQMVTPYDSKLVFVQKITSVLRKINKKLLPPELHFLTPMCTIWFVGWGFAPDPTGGAYSAPPDLLAVFRRPTSKGKEGKRRGRGGREFVLCPRKKKEK